MGVTLGVVDLVTSFGSEGTGGGGGVEGGGGGCGGERDEK